MPCHAMPFHVTAGCAAELSGAHGKAECRLPRASSCSPSAEALISLSLGERLGDAWTPWQGQLSEHLPREQSSLTPSEPESPSPNSSV